MSSATAFEAFETALSSWTTLPVVFENHFYEPTEPFVYAEIFGDSYNQDTFGAPQANMWEERGTTYLHVMVPSGEGSSQARDYANSLMYLFREQPIDTLVMDEMSIGAGDPGKDFPNFWALTLTIFWRRRDITSIPTP